MKKKEIFYQSFLELTTEDEVRRYLRDLLTPAEISEFAERLCIAKMLNENITYVEITRQTSASSTTIARVNLWLTKGRSGYKLVLSRLHHRHSSPAHL